MTLREREGAHFLQTYKRLPLEVESAEGMRIRTTDGRSYLDFLGGIAVNALGHGDHATRAAIERQLVRYTHLSNYFYQGAQIEFAERLCALAGYQRVFLANSGTEANEGAIKLARSWGSATGRSTIVGLTGGFHGRTYGVLSIMDRPGYKEGMGPFLPDTRVLPFNDPEALAVGIDEHVCAVVIEFLQGEGGVRWVSREFVERLVSLRERFGFLIVADEIQAGAGRTGDFFSFERFGLRPDIVTLAKGIGGGLPLGAILATEELAEVWKPGQHGTTFGGNALACAAGGALLERLETGLMAEVARRGEEIELALTRVASRHPELVREVRGAGVMWGMELTMPAAPIVERMLARGVIINATADTVLRFVPPYIVSSGEITEMAEALDASFAAQ